MSKNKFLSKEGYDKLVKELQELKQVKLPDILERLAEAKAMGDLSENFEYKSAMEDKDFVHSRIGEIEELLNNVEIIDTESKKGVKIVEFGSKVTIEIEDDKAYEITIVGTGEVNINDGMNISFDSPIGQAIRGKKVGDVAKIRLANSRKDVKIIAIK